MGRFASALDRARGPRSPAETRRRFASGQGLM